MLRVIGNDQSLPRQEHAVASGTLPNGKPVIVNSDGTVSVVEAATGTESIGTEVVFESGMTRAICSVYDTANDRIVIAYRDDDNSNYGTAVVGTVGSNTISFGTPVVFNTGNTNQLSITFDSSNNKVVIAYRDIGNSGYGTGIVGTVSGTSISFGTEVVFESAAIEQTSSAFDVNAGKVVIAYRDDGNSTSGTAVIGTVSGTSISFGTPVVFNSGASGDYSVVYNSDAQNVIIAYRRDSDTSGQAVVGTVSGTSISFGSKNEFTSNNLNYVEAAYDVGSQTIVIAYQDSIQSSHGYVVAGSISGNTITFGTPVRFNQASTVYPFAAYHSAAKKVVIAYVDETSSSNHGKFTVVTVSGTSITLATASTFASASTNYTNIVYDPDTEQMVVSYRDVADSNKGKSTVFSIDYSTPNLTSENYIGMSRGVVDVTSQTQSIGSAVVYNNAGNTTKPHLCFDTSNNKVVIGFVDNALTEKGSAIVGTVSGTSISFGTKTAYEQSVTDFPAMVFDSSNNKVVVAYQDEGNSDYGTAAVGTVSGTSISFGTPVVFESAAVQHVSLAFDSSSNKVVVSYSDHGNSEHGTAIVGTVSGTSISFGSATVFQSSQSQRINSTFDSSNNKVVIAYRTSTGQAVVGTVSGTSISFGSPVQFKDELTDELDIVFDSNANKVVIAYLNGAGSLGLAKVGTVSGTSISFGTEATFNSSGATYSISPVFDNSINKVVLLYQNAGNSNYGTSAVGTISGTDITFETPTVFASVNVGSAVGATFDSSNNKVVIAYRDGSNSNYGTSVVMLPGFTDITRGEVANSSNVSIDIIGSVSDNQLSLTAGQQYYVQTDGTISTTAGSPSVLAGTAISATELLVKT